MPLPGNRSIIDPILLLRDLVVETANSLDKPYRVVVSELNEILSPDDKISVSTFNNFAACTKENLVKPSATYIFAFTQWLKDNQNGLIGKAADNFIEDMIKKNEKE